jgi:hypothetical protein
MRRKNKWQMSSISIAWNKMGHMREKVKAAVGQAKDNQCPVNGKHFPCWNQMATSNATSALTMRIAVELLLPGVGTDCSMMV